MIAARILLLVVASTALSACGTVEERAPEKFAETGAVIAHSGGKAGAVYACFTCHGLDGMGDGAGAPRLAGLHAGYLERQLLAYADGLRQHEPMEWVSGRLTAQQRRDVSAYYAAMPVRVDGGLPASAPDLFVDGDPSRGIPACSSCHGLQGEGVGPANPPLAGQPAAYLQHQMEQWRRGQRRSDPLGQMLVISQRLTPSEIAALADYSARLPAATTSEIVEASLAERRSGPRNDASVPPRRASR